MLKRKTGGLVLTRAAGESVVITVAGRRVRITYRPGQGSRYGLPVAALRIQAPPDVKIYREELVDGL